jgi:hypothetical protein
MAGADAPCAFNGHYTPLLRASMHEDPFVLRVLCPHRGRSSSRRDPTPTAVASQPNVGLIAPTPAPESLLVSPLTVITETGDPGGPSGLIAPHVLGREGVMSTRATRLQRTAGWQTLASSEGRRCDRPRRAGRGALGSCGSASSAMAAAMPARSTSASVASLASVWRCAHEEAAVTLCCVERRLGVRYVDRDRVLRRWRESTPCVCCEPRTARS